MPAKIAHCIGRTSHAFGNDDITIPLMSIGGSGVISVYANVMPKVCHEIVREFRPATRRKLRRNTRGTASDERSVSGGQPHPRKTAMNLMGLNVGPAPAPYEMSDDAKHKLEATMREAGLL